MPRLAILFGALLVLLGIGAYVANLGGDKASWTALIPAFFGLPILLLGLAGLKDSVRKHAMHAASALALLGVIGALGRPVALLLSGKLHWGVPLASQIAMALLCGVFLGLCVKSFVDARRRRA